MIATNFTFGERTAYDYGVMICDFNDNSEITTTGSKVELSTSKAPNSDTWMRTNASYTEQLSFSFSICKLTYESSSQTDMEFSAYDQVDIYRWLVRNDYEWLNFEQDGFEDVYYHCQIQLEKKEAGGSVIGFTATVTCDAPFGFSEERTVSINDTIDKIFDSSNKIGYIIPTTVATVTADGKIEIYNDNVNETVIVANCISGEELTFTPSMRISTTSTAHTTLYDDFNWVFPKIQNSFDTNENTFILTNCELTMTYREIRRAVI